MNRTTLKLFGVTALVFLFAATTPLFAQRPYDITVGPGGEVAVPGYLLGPGHYSLTRVDSDNLHTYRLINDDTMQVVGAFYVIPDKRNHFGPTSVILSAPDAAGLRMIQAWYPADGRNGYQFVYSNKDVRKLDEMAKSQQQPIGSAGGQP